MNAKSLLLLCLIVFVAIISSAQGKSNRIEVGHDDDDDVQTEWYSLTSQYTVVKGKNVAGSIAWGYFKDELFKDGWGKLSIETAKNLTDSNAFKAAGYLEGYLSAEYITNFSHNYFMGSFNTTNVKEFPLNLMEFVTNNLQWMNQQIASNPTDPYWVQVSYVMDQLDGLLQGYNDAVNSTSQLQMIELALINLIGDIEDVQSALSFQSGSQANTDMSQKDLERYLATRGRCSALIKLTPDFQELYLSHTTWGSYSSMMRIFKKTKIHAPSTPNGVETLFASYPGVLVSDDDFYMIYPSKLVVTETTNSILNMSIYSTVNSSTLMYYVRNLVANRLANTAPEWMQLFAKYNSGTYNNQWMVVDYKLFTPGQDLKPNLFWIGEQMPGAFPMQDMTETLALGYWPSFNRPFFDSVYEAMGYPWYVEKYGIILSQQLNPRANMFRRDQSNVFSIDDMQSIMTYNQYKTDPFSYGYPGNAISARYDIMGGPDEPDGWSYVGTHGGIDTKITGYQLVSQKSAVIRNGPAVTSDCPPFSWSAWPNVPHQGLPNTYNFNWVTVKL